MFRDYRRLNGSFEYLSSEEQKEYLGKIRVGELELLNKYSDVLMNITGQQFVCGTEMAYYYSRIDWKAGLCYYVVTDHVIMLLSSEGETFIMPNVNEKLTNEFIEQLKSLGYLEAVTAIRRDGIWK